MCVKFLEDALGQKLPRRPQSGPGEQLTVFQFWSYFEALDSSSMEAYVTETAEEGEAVALVTKWPDAMGGSEGVNSGHEGIQKNPRREALCPASLFQLTPAPARLPFFSVTGAESELR